MVWTSIVTPATKGNDGRSKRQQLLRKIQKITCLLVIFIATYHYLTKSDDDGSVTNVSDRVRVAARAAARAKVLAQRYRLKGANMIRNPKQMKRRPSPPQADDEVKSHTGADDDPRKKEDDDSNKGDEKEDDDSNKGDENLKPQKIHNPRQNGVLGDRGRGDRGQRNRGQGGRTRGNRGRGNRERGKIGFANIIMNDRQYANRTPGNKRPKYDSKTDKEKVDLILSGKVFLVNLDIYSEGLAAENGYEDVMGDFCELDWSSYKKDPSSIPMFRDLVMRSSCARTSFSYDLKKIVALAKAYDNSNVRTISPTAFVFHESRCGSTLVANSLTAMDPQRHRVYSESQPPVIAIKACGLPGGNSKRCPPHRAAELLKDVVYIMGRTSDLHEENLFFKFQSVSSKYLDVVMEAFPKTPWIFVYRDPVQIMMSQLRRGVTRANCVRQLRDIPMRDREFLTSIDQEVYDLSPEEKCAFHLSTLCNAAMEAIDHSKGLGIGINYENIVEKLITDVFPHHFALEMSDERRKRILDVSSHYSKGRGMRENQLWKQDSKEKEESATIEVREASDTFLYPSYKLLEKSMSKDT